MRRDTSAHSSSSEDLVRSASRRRDGMSHATGAHVHTREPEPSAEPLETRYMRVRQGTESLARPLSPEDQLVQSMPDASPVKWHLAHTSWFFETFVLAGLAG